MTRRAARDAVLITGGAGFVGTNLADHLARDGRQIVIFDNLSRPGVSANLRWLKAQHGAQVSAVIADIRDAARLREAVAQARSVFHLAAQVAVTTSLIAPMADLETNIVGTLTLLEAVRATGAATSLVFTSTNKVYGLMDDLAVAEQPTRYAAAAADSAGISERRPLDFHSPYGCSKGAADQYVLDYARSFGLPTAVFRMSCIYGPHQHGTEDQGWVAHFAIRAHRDQPITIYGDGKQVRDILFVDDLVEAFRLAEHHMPAIAGQAFNIGGGPANALSLIELLAALERRLRRPVHIRHDAWRTGDQRWYVSDTHKFTTATGWAPRVTADVGVQRLCDWIGRGSKSEPLKVAS